MYKRTLENPVREASLKYPVVAIVGPRQSGKTTLAVAVFPEKKYVTLEDPAVRSFAEKDPEGFLSQFPDGAILDEIQRVPGLFSHLQVIVDKKKQEGLFILTGSQHFSLMEKITQSLAGRVAIRKLLPLSYEEIAGRHPDLTLNEILFRGGYPRIFDKSLSPTEWLGDYVETYLDRDVRLVKNIGDLSSFHTFVKMAAARSGQLVNLSSLGNDCGINHNTAKSWLSVLQTSFVSYDLPPYSRNFNKRLKKSSKLYLFDTGLLCYLLGIASADDLAAHPHRGAIFETFVLSELVKARYHRALPLNLHFWQDQNGREIDCVIEKGKKLILVEIKAGRTIAEDYFANFQYLRKIAGKTPLECIVFYAGEADQPRSAATVLGWKNLAKPDGLI